MMGKNKVFIAIGIIVALLAAAAGGYMYYKRTPTYTFNLIKEAVEKHDYDTFSRHVDTENIISCAYDDLMAADLDDDDTDECIKGFADGFIKMLKPGIVGALDDSVKQFVKTGKSDSENAQQEKKDNLDSQQAADNLKKKTNFDNISFKGIGDLRKEGDFSVVGVIFSDKQLGKDFTIELKMLQLDDGTWKILQISNMKEYLKAIEDAKKEKLAEINKPLQSEIDSRISLQAPVAEIVNRDSWGFSQAIQLSIPANINSDKRIAHIAGTVKITTNEGKTFAVPYEKDLNSINGNTTIAMQYDLNPFLSRDNKMIKEGINGYSFEVTVSKVVFADNSSIELKTELE